MQIGGPARATHVPLVCTDFTAVSARKPAGPAQARRPMGPAQAPASTRGVVGMELAHPLEVNPPSLYETPETAWPGHFISAYGLAYTLCWKICNTLTEEEAWQEMIENYAIAATDRLHWAYFGNPWFWAKRQPELNAPGHGRISSAQAQVNAAALAFAQRKCMAEHMAQRKRGCATGRTSSNTRG